MKLVVRYMHSCHGPEISTECLWNSGVHYGKSELHTSPQCMVEPQHPRVLHQCLIQPRSIAMQVTIVQMSECLFCIFSSFSVSHHHLFLPLQWPWNSDNVLHLCRKAVGFVCTGPFFVSVHRAHFIFFSSSNSDRPRICCCDSQFIAAMFQYLINAPQGRTFILVYALIDMHL